jgi:peptidylprolyl isomerase/FKBP-type peptidyl-prolyl cis-trans isomerase FklB
VTDPTAGANSFCAALFGRRLDRPRFVETPMKIVLRAAVVLVAALTLAACAKAPPNPEAATAGKAFLAAHARAPGVHVTASGLQYEVIHSGPASGTPPKATDEVKVNYEGRLLDGAVFDSTYQRGVPAVFAVNGVIPAWTEALQLMRPGDQWRLYAPPELAYGDAGAGPIPPGSVLVFTVELIAVSPS